MAVYIMKNKHPIKSNTVLVVIPERSNEKRMNESTFDTVYWDNSSMFRFV